MGNKHELLIMWISTPELIVFYVNPHTTGVLTHVITASAFDDLGLERVGNLVTLHNFVALLLALHSYIGIQTWLLDHFGVHCENSLFILL